MSTITVGISDMNVARGDDVLVTFALGSCIGICIYDTMSKTAALGHIMLPFSPNAKGEATPYKYADTCIPIMLNKLAQMNCPKATLTAKIAGGAKMFEISGDSTFGNIGQRNTDAVKQVLRENGVRIIAEDTGLNFGRTVYFHAADGKVEVKSFNRELKIL